jgi:hypothetical protein
MGVGEMEGELSRDVVSLDLAVHPVNKKQVYPSRHSSSRSDGQGVEHVCVAWR